MSVRREYRVPVFLGGLQYGWYRSYGTAHAAANAVAAVLRAATHYEGAITVELEETPRCLVGTGWFKGHGDAPFAAAARALELRNMHDPRAGLLMFAQVREHNLYARERRRRDMDADAAAARPTGAGGPPAGPSTQVVWPDDEWRRALRAAGAKPDFRAFGRPLIHRTLTSAREQCDRDRDACRIVWAYDLPSQQTSGAPKRYVAASRQEFESAYEAVHPSRRQAYEVIDARSCCWPYFDLEFSTASGLNSDVDGDALTRQVCRTACDILFRSTARRPLEIDVVVLASERATKFSRHVVLRPHWSGIPRVPAPLAGSGAARLLADAVIATLGPTCRVQASAGADAVTTKPFVDARVYSRERCFRVAGSTKLGDPPSAAFVVCDRQHVRGGPIEVAVSAAFAPTELQESLVVPALLPTFDRVADCLPDLGSTMP